MNVSLCICMLPDKMGRLRKMTLEVTANTGYVFAIIECQRAHPYRGKAYNYDREKLLAAGRALCREMGWTWTAAYDVV